MTLGPARNGRWRQLRGDLALLLAGLGLALVVWFVITDSENEPIEERLGFELAVEQLNVPATLAVANRIPSISVTVVGREEDVLDAVPDDFRATIDLGGLPEGTHEVPVRALSQRDRVRVRAVLPQSVEVTLEAVVEREVPVRVVLRNLPAIGFTIGDPLVEPSTVIVSGVQQLVDLVDAVIAPVDLATATVEVARSVTVQAQTAAGATVSRIRIAPDVVTVRVPVQQEVFRRTAAVAAEVIGNPASGHRVVRVDVLPSTVEVLATLDAFEGLISVRTTDVIIQGQAQTVEESVGLETPEGIAIAEEAAVRVRVVIEPIEVSTVLQIPIQVNGQEPGSQVVVSPQFIIVRVSGPAAELAKVDGLDIQASVDVAALPSGQHVLSLRFEAPDGLEAIASREEVEVLIALPEPESPAPEPAPDEAEAPADGSGEGGDAESEQAGS